MTYLNALHDACGTVFTGLRATLPVLFLPLAGCGAAMGPVSPPFSCAKTAAIDGIGNTTAQIISWRRRQRYSAGLQWQQPARRPRGCRHLDGGLGDDSL
jgi:hypothetical protein